MPNSTILLISNDDQVSDLLERAVLKPAGFQVAQVKDPTAAKAIIRSSPIDAMILEFALDGADLKLVDDLVETFPGIPLILLKY